MKIAIFLPNWLGDAVMATPALRAIRRRFPVPARLVGVMRPNLDELLAGTAWLDEQWYFDPRAAEAPLRRGALIRRLRRERLDLAVLFPNSLDTGLVACLGGVRQRLGHVRHGRGPLLTHKLHPPRRRGRVTPAPMVNTYLELAYAVGCPPESPRLQLATTKADERLAEGIWGRLGLRADGRVVALNPGGAYGEAKRWPAAHFAALARRICDELDHDVLVLCGPNERQVAREIATRADRRRVVSLAEGPLGLGSTKACVRRARLMVSTDSGPRHLAAAFGKPVITLLGPTLPVWIENPTVRGAFVRRQLDCLGCGRRACPLGHHRCMQELSVETVLTEVAAALRQQEEARAA